MKTEKGRYSTLELVVYRKSNTTRMVYFHEFAEAADFAVVQRNLHPRSKKLNGCVADHETGKLIKVA